MHHLTMQEEATIYHALSIVKQEIEEGNYPDFGVTVEEVEDLQTKVLYLSIKERENRKEIRESLQKAIDSLGL